jgi:hypothetical protein
MEAVEQWESEKQAHAEQLYAALAALVGDVQALHRTSASLSWRSGAGIQGHWRMIQEQVWLGRIVTYHTEGLTMEQLALALDSVPEEQGRIGLAHPVMYHGRTGEGVVTSYDPETPEIYAAASTLVIRLAAELQAMLAHLSERQEDPDHEP